MNVEIGTGACTLISASRAFFYCVSSDASDRPKNARNRVEKNIAASSRHEIRERERMRETLKELKMARKRMCEREK